MRIALTLIGAVLGLYAGDISTGFLGLLAGATVGALVATLRAQRERLRELEARVAALDSRRAEPAPVEARPAPEQAAVPPRAVPIPTAPRPPLPPRAPNAVERALALARTWLLTGNVPVKVGVIVSFFGVAFLLKYAVDEGLLSAPIELRLASVALAGMALLVLGWRVRDRNPVYALSIQGGGVGILYLTVFAALRLYELLTPVSAFALLVALTLSASVLAVLQRAQSLALLGAAGGFLAPLLVSTGTGSHVALFGYYLVLDLAILGIAWFMPWRWLFLTGFAFTFGVAAFWGVPYYQPAHFASVEPFLLAYFLIYVAIAVLCATRHAPERGGLIDGALVFGLPVVAFAYQAELVEPYAFARAYSALGAAIVYGGLAQWLRGRAGSGARLLCEAFLALATSFGTIAIPLALDAQWTSAAWALEGAGLVWLGLRQSRRIAQLGGVALQLAASAVLLDAYDALAVEPPLVNGRVLGGALVAFATLASGVILQRLAPGDSAAHRLASIGLVGIGASWWYASGVFEADRSAPERYALPLALGFCAISAAVFHVLAVRLAGTRLNLAAAALPALLLGATLAWASGKEHPVQDLGFLFWPAAVAVQLRLADRLASWQRSYARGAAHFGLWLGAGLLAWETHWALAELAPRSAWPVAGAIAALALVGHATARVAPSTRFADLAVWGAALLLLTALALAIAQQLSSGDPRPLVYLPLANPIDVVTLASAGAALLWYRARGPAAGLAPQADRGVWACLAATGFLLLTMTTVRTFHHWAGVPLAADAILHADGLQAALSIVWAALGVTSMFAGARFGRRVVWMVGAALMALVVAKLFLVDLGNTDTVARIVSFIGVGALLLAIGWLAPLPARAAGELR